MSRPAYVLGAFVLLLVCISNVIAPGPESSSSIRRFVADHTTESRAKQVLRHWCNDCPPGKEQIYYCNQTHPTQCRPCQYGFFSASHDRLPCRPCSTCAPKQLMVGECTRTRDTQCVEKDSWANKAWLMKKLAEDDASPDDKSSSINEEISSIESVQSGRGRYKIKEDDLPHGPPVEPTGNSRYTAGVYRRRGTLGVESGNDSPPQPPDSISGATDERTTTEQTSLMNETRVPEIEDNKDGWYDATDEHFYGTDGDVGDEGNTESHYPNYNYPSGPQGRFPAGMGPQGHPGNGQGFAGGAEGPHGQAGTPGRTGANSENGGGGVRDGEQMATGGNGERGVIPPPMSHPGDYSDSEEPSSSEDADVFNRNSIADNSDIGLPVHKQGNRGTTKESAVLKCAIGIPGNNDGRARHQSRISEKGKGMGSNILNEKQSIPQQESTERPEIHELYATKVFKTRNILGMEPESSVQPQTPNETNSGILQEKGTTKPLSFGSYTTTASARVTGSAGVFDMSNPPVHIQEEGIEASEEHNDQLRGNHYGSQVKLDKTKMLTDNLFHTRVIGEGKKRVDIPERRLEKKKEKSHSSWRLYRTRQLLAMDSDNKTKQQLHDTVLEQTSPDSNTTIAYKIPVPLPTASDHKPEKHPGSDPDDYFDEDVKSLSPGKGHFGNQVMEKSKRFKLRHLREPREVNSYKVHQVYKKRNIREAIGQSSNIIPDHTTNRIQTTTTLKPTTDINSQYPTIGPQAFPAFPVDPIIPDPNGVTGQAGFDPGIRPMFPGKIAPDISTPHKTAPDSTNSNSQVAVDRLDEKQFAKKDIVDDEIVTRGIYQSGITKSVQMYPDGTAKKESVVHDPVANKQFINTYLLEEYKTRNILNVPSDNMEQPESSGPVQDSLIEQGNLTSAQPVTPVELTTASNDKTWVNVNDDSPGRDGDDASPNSFGNPYNTNTGVFSPGHFGNPFLPRSTPSSIPPWQKPDIDKSNDNGKKDDGPLNNIIMWAVLGCAISFLVLAAGGIYMVRMRMIKQRVAGAGESCAMYDAKSPQDEEGGVSILLNPSCGDQNMFKKDRMEPDIGEPMKHKDSIVSEKGVILTSNTRTKMPSRRHEANIAPGSRPGSFYDNITNTADMTAVESTFSSDPLSRQFEEALEQMDSGHDSGKVSRSSPSGGRLVVDSGTRPSVVPLNVEFTNPVFTQVKDIEADGPPGTSSSATNAATAVVTSSVILSDQSSVLDSLSKDMVKPSNVNFNTESPIPKAQPRSYGDKPFKTSESSDSFGGIYGARGGVLRSQNSAVSLKIPRGAIQEDESYAIRGYIHLDLRPFVKHIQWEEGECFISPIPEYHVIDGRTFNRLVQINIPHCLDEEELLPYIRVQHGDPANNRPFQDVPEQAKENNIRQDIYFSVEENFIKIYTFHFTQFICSCKKPYNLQLEAMLFGSYSCLGEQEVKLRLYLCDALFKVDDFRQDLIKREKHKLLESSTIALPCEGLNAQCEVDMELHSQDADWQPQTICGVIVQSLKQTKKIGDLVCCHASRYEAPVAADFVMVPRSNAAKKTFFKGGVFVTPHILLNSKNSPSKQRKKKLGFFNSGKNKSVEKDKDKADECQRTIIWFGFSFGYDAQRSQRSQTGNRQPSDVEEGEDDEELDEDLLDAFEYVAKHLPRNDILPLSRKLGLEQTLMEEIEYSHGNSLQEQKMQMLLMWKRKKAEQATVQKLMKYLLKIQQMGMVEQLSEQLRMEIDNRSYSSDNDKPRTKKVGLKIPSRSGYTKKRPQSSKIRGGYVTQSSTENCSPDYEKSINGGFRTSESEGYQSSGSNKSMSRIKTKDRPHVKISDVTPNVDIRKDQLSKKPSRLKRLQNGNNSSKLTRAHGPLGSNGSTDSDLIVSEGGSDVAEESDIEEEEDEVATSTMLDCLSRETDTESSSPDIEPVSPDSLLHQTVPKTLDESYTLEHVVV